MEYINAKVILQPSSGDWFGCDGVINLYHGCSHGCIYCDSRSDCYKIKHFETVAAKRDALALLENELLHKRKKGVVALGSMSDSYNPCEKELELTRGALKLLERFRFGVSVDTKSDLVLRDTDILRAMAAHSPVVVKFSVTTSYDALSKKLEPKVCATSKRMAALKTLSEAGIYTGVMLTPVLPFITDNSADILSIVDMAADTGCKFVYAGESFGMTLRDSQRAHYFRKLDKLYPDLREKYIRTYGETYYCVSENNGELYKAFENRCRERGLKYKMKVITDEYIGASQPQQISLFDF